MVYPLEPRRLFEFADGLETIVVLDDRRGFLEEQIRSALCNQAGSPLVLGQRDDAGKPWLAAEGALTAELLSTRLGPFLSRRFSRPEFEERSKAAARRQHDPGSLVSLQRRPHFCSGCPHLTSTRVPEGHAAAAGIGCHTMLILSGGEARYIGAMGSEGAHWNGLSRYVDTPHLFQNVGDGTYFHSARLSIRASVAAGSRITFKLLWNGAVAMTGGQAAAGGKPLVAVLRDLLSDGVQRIIAVSDDPGARALAREDERVACVGRDRAEDAMIALSQEEGVTVFIYDEMCANEKQRRQKRGLHPAPQRRIYINTDVCEGCGDCGEKSACLSVHPIDTALGRKTRIHQGTCAQDETCLQGDCPAFLTLDGETRIAPIAVPQDLQPPDSDPRTPDFEEDFNVLMIGVGSTGVVTVDALLVEAARIEGYCAAHIDQIGLSQRGGRVASHLRLARSPIESSAHVPWGGADTLLAFDALGANDSSGLVYLSSDRTQCVMHSCVSPTASMVSNPREHPPQADALAERLARHTRRLDSLPAEELCIALFGSHQSANVMLLGYAFECGAIPLASATLEEAIRSLAVAVDANLAAFRAGRAFRARPQYVASLLKQARPPAIGEDGSPERARELFPAEWERLGPLLSHLHDASTSPDPTSSAIPLERRVAGWALDLAEYQNAAWGARYLQTLLPVVEAEISQHARRLLLSNTVARELYRLMAYKDEYEVARLHLRSPFRRWLDERSGGTARPVYWLHPPLLRALGMRHKLQLGRVFGRSFELLLRVLASLRFVRGTAFDPFGRTAARQLERDLIGWYEALLATVVERIESMGLPRALEVAECAALIRGYEDIKERAAAAARERAEKLLDW
jgi:indolepyruvate ferredoxin oxidoreductase